MDAGDWWLLLSNWIAYPPAALILLFAPADRVYENWREYRAWIIAVGLLMPLLSTNYHLCTIFRTAASCFNKDANSQYEHDLLSSLTCMVLLVALLVPLRWRLNYVVVSFSFAWLVVAFTSAGDYGPGIFMTLQVLVLTTAIWPQLRGDATYVTLYAYVAFLVSTAVAVTFKIEQAWNYPWMHGGAWHIGTGFACAVLASLHVYHHSDAYELALVRAKAPRRLRRTSRMRSEPETVRGYTAV